MVSLSHPALALLMSSGLEILGGLCVVFGEGRRGVCVGLAPVCLQLDNMESSTPSVWLEPEAACLCVLREWVCWACTCG